MKNSFDAAGSPGVEIKVFGADQRLDRDILAVVDTGFTGFLLLSTQIALPLGLIPHATIDVTLADGSSHSKFISVGNIELDSQTSAGIIILEDQNTEALIGMEFLKSFRATLIVDTVASTVEILSRKAV